MTPNPPKTPIKVKDGKTDRHKRLGTALRENLRKRKSQSQEREKTRTPEEKGG